MYVAKRFEPWSVVLVKIGVGLVSELPSWSHILRYKDESLINYDNVESNCDDNDLTARQCVERGANKCMGTWQYWRLFL